MPAPNRLVAAIVVATALTAGAGIGVRLAACSNACMSDLGRDFQNRGIRPDAFPYVSPNANFEYPVGTGLVFWAVTLVADTARSFFTVTSLAALVLAVLTAWLLARRYGNRAWYFALAPPLALYGSANWDLFALAPAVAGLLAFERQRDTRAGVLLGIGAAMKIYPGLFVAPLVANRLRSGDARGAARLFGWSAGTVALVNVPVLVARPSGWLYALRFQSKRTPTWGSLWHYAIRTPALHLWVSRGSAPGIGNVGGLLALLSGMAVVTWLAWRHALGPIAASAAATAVFLLSNKVYSPQYDLWLVPFFVMLAVPRRDYVAYVLADIGIFVLVFGSLGHHFGWTRAWAYTMLALVVLRVAAIVALVRDGARVDSPDSPDAPRPVGARLSPARPTPA